MTDITALINSENKGDRIKALNTIRELEPAIAFGYIKQLVTDKNTRVRIRATTLNQLSTTSPALLKQPARHHQLLKLLKLELLIRRPMSVKIEPVGSEFASQDE